MTSTFTQPQKEKLDAIRVKHGLQVVLLHGSHSGDTAHQESDIDIAVVRNEQKPPFRYIDLLDDLTQVFDSDRIDLVDLTHADPLLLFAAARTGRLLSGDPKRFAALQQKAFHRYNDYLPYLSAEKQFVRKRIETYVTD